MSTADLGSRLPFSTLVSSYLKTDIPYLRYYDLNSYDNYPSSNNMFAEYTYLDMINMNMFVWGRGGGIFIP